MPSASDPLRFFQISDTHINPAMDYNKDYAPQTPLVGAKALVSKIQSLPFKPDFILHTGDVAYDPHPVYDTVRELFAEIDVPIHYLAGNHDDSSELQRVLMQRNSDAIQQYLHYDFTVKGVQFVCLDSNGPHDPEKPTGFVTQEQLDWLDSICASDDEHPLVIAVHHNVLPVYVPWLDDWMRMENGEAFHEIVRQARDRLCGVFHGHIHQNIQTIRDGVTYISCGSPWCQFESHPDLSNTRFTVSLNSEASFNMVTITDSTTSVIRQRFDN